MMVIVQAGRRIAPSAKSDRVIFLTFCLWNVVLLCRPQDYVVALASLRPGLISSVVMLAVLTVCSGRIHGPPLFQEQQVKYYSALLFLMVASIPTSLYVQLSFTVVFTQYILVVLYFFIFYKVINSVNKLKTILLLGCLGSGIYMLVTLFSGAHDHGRLSYGTMFDSNDLAYFSLVFLPFSFLFCSHRDPLWMRLACMSVIGASTLVILLSGSRGGVLAFIVALTIFLAKAKAIKALMKFFIVMCCVIFLAVAPIDIDRYSTVFSLEDDYNVQSETGRFAIWKIGMGAMLANPLTGVGVMCFPEVVGKDREMRGAETFRWQTAHNSVIQIGTETGIIGLAIFVLLSLNVLRIFNRVSKQSQQCELVRISEMGLVGFIGMFTAAMFLSQAYSIYWAFYVVLSAVVNQMLIKEHTSCAGNFKDA